MDPVFVALVAAGTSFATFVAGQWLLRRWRGPTDREQWDTERTAWMGTLSARLDSAEDKLQTCELRSLEQARTIDQLRARVADLERRTGKAGELLKHDDPDNPRGGN